MEFGNRRGGRNIRGNRRGFNELTRSSINFKDKHVTSYSNQIGIQLKFEDIMKVLQEMLQEDYSDNLSKTFLKHGADITDILNDKVKHDLIFSETIIKVVLKASREHDLDKDFRELFTLVLASTFASKKIDSLISVFLPTNPDTNMFQLLVTFLKLAFNIFPGKAYDMFYYRINNLFVLLEIPHFNLNVMDNTRLELLELRVLADTSCPFRFEDKKKKVEIDSREPPDNFRCKSIFPSAAELLNIESKDVFLRKNKSQGAYSSVDDYLDVLFRLTHEDFIQPLREGLREYKENRDKRSFNIRVYTNVRILCTAPNRRLGIVHYIQLDKRRIKNIKWCQSKRLIYGSLLCFSSDDFETLLFATVANRDDKDINEGILAVKFVDKVTLDNKQYTLLETMNMFESYKHVLTKLQKTNSHNLCMKKYLVFAETEIALPRYVGPETRYMFNNRTIQPGITNSVWPHRKYLQMNKSQFIAFKSALTKELTLIQGPPGTGKTYLGLKICSCLVKNRPLADGPILVVCYTNHALDQFLEGISEFTDEILRIGGQSQSEKIQKFSLQNRKINSDISYFKKRKYIVHETLTDLEYDLNFQSNVYNSILQIALLRVFMSEEQYIYLEVIGMHTWLSGKCLLDLQMTNIDNMETIVEEILYEEIISNLESIVMSLVESSPFENDKKSESKSNVDDDYITKQRLLDVDLEDINSLNTRFNKIMTLPQQSQHESPLDLDSLNETDKMSEEEVRDVSCLDELSIENRWRLYQYWRFLYKRYLTQLSVETKIQYESFSRQLNDLNYQEDEEIMKNQRIIGMTTTGAARYSDVLARIQCKVIIVEEAAEVLESHIIGSLNAGCQHLVLMGDHKQLRPNPAVYELAKKYNLDLSLFERLVNNNLHYNTLSVQHRMRPEIADIVRFVYDDLQDSPSVSLYPNVPAIRTNLFFFNHSKREELKQEITSYCNQFEAQMIVKFCHHLIENGVDSSKITILTLYSGQMFLFKTLMNNKWYDGVRVCVVDNYQGEENDIILLSLVRSNDEMRIGFVGIDNRICVSLSRAKHGLYVFGNFDLLSSKSELWRKICQHLRNRNMLGASLNMFCQNHPEKELVIRTAIDFSKYPDCGCEQLCNTLLRCGHICTRYCHFLDKDHVLFECQYKCTRSCLLGHKCELRCFEDCNCVVEVEKIIPDCNHCQLMSCYKIPEASDCRSPCEKVLNCGHVCTKYCGESCGGCLTKVQKMNSTCGHLYEYDCCENELVCHKPCGSVLRCGHLCSGSCDTCYQLQLHSRCVNVCDADLICGHVCKASCSDSCSPCQYKCEEGCVHVICKTLCGTECMICREPCQWQCKHKSCTKLCYEVCDRDMCNETCCEFLKCIGCGCGFQCYGVCGERCRVTCSSCDSKIKEDTVYVTLWTCGHTFDVMIMDVYMSTLPSNGEIVRKKCPQCGVNITGRSCFRYTTIVKQISLAIQNVKRIINREISSYGYNYYRKVLEFSQHNVLQMLDRYGVNNSFTINDKDSCKGHTVYKYSTALSLLKIMAECVPLNVRIYVSGGMHQSIVKLIQWLNPNHRKFDDYETNWFFEEFEKIMVLINNGRIRRTFDQQRTFNKLSALSRLKKEWCYYLKNVRWFKCQRGHFYCTKIDEDDQCSTCVKG